jgi:hypothetical protein
MLKRVNEDFSIANQLKDFIRNYDWQSGFKELERGDLPIENGKIKLNECPGYGSLWVMLSGAFEEIGQKIYGKTANLVPSNIDLDVATIDGLKSAASYMAVEDMQFFDIDYPIEVKDAIELLSTPKGKMLVRDAVLAPASFDEASAYINQYDVSANMEGYISSASIWTESQANAISGYQVSGIPYYDIGRYLEYVEDQLSGILLDQITRERIIDDFYEKIYTTYEFTSETILDTPNDSDDITVLKKELGVPINFSAKSETDKIIRGEALLTDYASSEQQVIEAEVEERKDYSKYGVKPEVFRRFEYEAERKVREYIRFVENVNVLVKNLAIIPGDQYDEISGSTYRFFDYYDSGPLSGQPLSGDMIENATHFLRNVCLNTTYQRENLRTIPIKHQMLGTARIIENMISEYIYRRFSSPSASWNLYEFPELSAVNPISENIIVGADVSEVSSIIYNNIDVVEYLDNTEYLNLSAITDASSADVNERFWENLDLIRLTSEHTDAEVSSFYYNIGLTDMSYGEISAFINQIYDMGAVSATLENSGVYRLADDDLSGWTSGSLSGMFFKYLGVPSGEIPWANEKNIVHPTMALTPFLWNLIRKETNRLALQNIYNFIPRPFSETSARMQNWFNDQGSTINQWMYDNQAVSMYRDEYQRSTNLDLDFDEMERIDIDSPFYFEALSAYLASPTDFENDFSYWYGHLNLSDVEETKIKWQLTNHETVIRGLSGQNIYQYGIDKYGNHYTLFKEDKEFDTTGTLWMRYKDHPISFPFTVDDPSNNAQVDTTTFLLDAETFVEKSNACYDFGFVTLESTNFLWMFSNDPDMTSADYDSRIGSTMFTQLVHTDSAKNKIAGKRLKNNVYQINLKDRNEIHVGMYETVGANGQTMVYVTNSSFVPSTVNPGEYVATFFFRTYDNVEGWDQRYKSARAKYNIFTAPDNHNMWKLSKFGTQCTIAYECELLSGSSDNEFLGSNGNGRYDVEYNNFKNGWHNGIATFEFTLVDSTSFPQTYVSDQFMGYNDLTYMSIQAWEGWAGGGGIPSASVDTYGMNSENFVKAQFLGTSDPTTSARFDVGPVPMLCYNSNEEYFGLWAGNAYLTWADATFDWSQVKGNEFFPSGWVYDELTNDEASGFISWDDRLVGFRQFTTPGETWSFATSDEDGTFYYVDVTYLGIGCQNFRVDFRPDSLTEKSAKFTGSYWVYASHYGNVLDANINTVTATFNDPIEYQRWSVGDEISMIWEGSNGGSVLIRNEIADRAEYSVSGFISEVSADRYVASIPGNLFGVGDKVTLVNMNWSS